MNFSPVLRLALGLVGMITSVFILADIVIGVVPDEHARLNATREVIAHIATEQVAAKLNAQDRLGMEGALDAIRKQYPDLQAAVVREEGGALVATSGAFPPAGSTVRDTLDIVQVPIHSAQGVWGHVEFAFPLTAPKTLMGWFMARRVWLPVTLVAVMVLCAALYLRRALTYLDPTSVIPDRVRAAFDSLNEGVALLDRAGRVMLANRALRQMAAVEESKMHGRPLDEGAKLKFARGSGGQPWRVAIESATSVQGWRVTIGEGESAKTGSVDCSPIIDSRGKVRGCLVTLADMTEIERSNDKLRISLAELAMSKATIELQNQKLTRLALHDGLTGLLNRRAFFEAAETVLSRCLRSGSPVAVVMLDVDHFKMFNDKHGHATGDLVLQRVAQCLQDSIRTGDICGRYGGEEFCALMEGLSPAEAMGIAERIRSNIEAHAGLGIKDGADLVVTASLGLCAAPPADMELASMLNLADEAMYVSKRGGRNRVSASAPVPETAEAH